MLQPTSRMGRPLRHYVLIRLDIPLAQQIIQVGHACTQAAAKFGSTADSHLVLLGVVDERTLRQADRAISDYGILRVLYEDPDLPGASAICTALVPPTRHFNRYKLWNFSPPATS
jgi:hypothetical protein